MMVDGKGHVKFMAADGKDAPFVLMRARDRGGSLQVTGMSADGKKLQVRTLGVKGDTQSTEGGEQIFDLTARWPGFGPSGLLVIFNQDLINRQFTAELSGLNFVLPDRRHAPLEESFRMLGLNAR